MSDALKVAFGWTNPRATVGMSIGPAFGLSASNSAVEFIFQAFEAATITRLWYRQSSVTGTSPVYQISLQGVDASGLPDGTIKASGNAKATFTPVAGNNNTGNWINLTSSYTCTRGELLAIVIAYSSGTVNASNLASFSDQVASGVLEVTPYLIENTAGTRVRSRNQMLYGYGSASVAYGNPALNFTQQGFNDGSNPDEYALRFIVPATWFGSYKVAGVKALVGAPPAGSSLTWTLYDGTTALQTYTQDSDYFQGTTVTPMEILFTDTTLATLTSGNVYRLAVKNNHASSNMTLMTQQVTANADLAAYPGGIEWYQSTRNNAGAWTDVNTTRPFVEPLFSDFTGASKPVLVDMQGGMAA
jgi:hypothetical protein